MEDSFLGPDRLPRGEGTNLERRETLRGRLLGELSRVNADLLQHLCVLFVVDLRRQFGQLDNSDESVELKKPDASVPTNVTTVLVERVHYHDGAPWDSFADGFGASLQRIVVNAYGNDPTNWVATFPNPGAAYVGGARPVITSRPPA